MNDFVSDLTIFEDGTGPALYAGGIFTTAGDISANKIAKWNGSSWSALGSGLGSGANALVNALAVFDDGDGPALYAGGNFSTAGGVPSSHIAKWQVTCPPIVPTADSSGIDKARFISMTIPGSPTAAAGETALRVTFTSLHHVLPPYTDATPVPFTLFEGKSMWVGPPAQYIESESTLTPFLASHLQCAPHYQDWSTVGLLAVTGEAIVPSSIYNVENVSFACQNQETTAPCVTGGANVSADLTIKTSRSGDVVATFQDPNAAASQPDFDDIGALVNKFKSLLGAPIKAHAKLYGVDARGLMDLSPDVGFDDISLDVDAFKGKPYPYKPGKCTGAPATACKDNTDCVGTDPCILCP
jgi:hypothetical protein